MRITQKQADKAIKEKIKELCEIREWPIAKIHIKNGDAKILFKDIKSDDSGVIDEELMFIFGLRMNFLVKEARKYNKEMYEANNSRLN